MLAFLAEECRRFSYASQWIEHYKQDEDIDTMFEEFTQKTVYRW